MSNTNLTKKQQLAIIYRHTHKDYKGSAALGCKTILMLRAGHGTCLVALDCLTDAEIAERLPRALEKEAERLEAAAAKKAAVAA